MTSETRVFRTPLLEAAQRHENLAAGFLILVFTLLAAWDLVAGGIVVGKDTVTQYYPWYTYLGESLRSGEIPAWNPYQFSGAPFAADPLSGWTYLPAMIMFTILPVSAAAAGFLVVHLVLAGLSTCALARVLRISLAGALLAAGLLALRCRYYVAAARGPGRGAGDPELPVAHHQRPVRADVPGHVLLQGGDLRQNPPRVVGVASPAGVVHGGRPPTSRTTPKRSSNACRWLDTAGCVMPSSLPAAENEPHSNMQRKTRSP